MEGQTEVWKDIQTEGMEVRQKYDRKDRWKDKKTDVITDIHRQTDRLKDRQMKGQTDGLQDIYRHGGTTNKRTFIQIELQKVK